MSRDQDSPGDAADSPGDSAADSPGDSAADSFLRQVARVPELLLPAPQVQPAPRTTPPKVPTLGELPEVSPQTYELRGEFARGGMGRIVLAYDRRLHRIVALKELLSNTPEAEARFVHEAAVTARLQHPSIVPVHEAGRWPDGKPFYAMKLVSGRSLLALLREQRELRLRLGLLPMVLAVTEAMAYAHSQGIIHRDIKAANVMVGDFGETVVVDWGLAKSLGEDGIQRGPTLPGSVLGTPGFMPPEQARGERVDQRVDVYSLGALLYHVLAGEPPYPGTTSRELLHQLQEGPPAPLGLRQPGVPPDLLAIVDQAMARDPSARYPSAQELTADLRRFLTGQLVAAHRYSRLTLVTRWLRRHRALVAVSAAALALVVGMAAVSVRGVVRARASAQRDLAAAEQARSHEATRLLELILQQVPLPGSPPSGPGASSDGTRSSGRAVGGPAGLLLLEEATRGRADSAVHSP